MDRKSYKVTILKDKNTGLLWRCAWSDTGAVIRSENGLASATRIIDKEYDKFFGARRAGTGKRNWKRFLKSVEGLPVGNKRPIDMKILSDRLHENKVDWWTV